MELVKPVEPVLWACIVELVMGGTGYGTVEALLLTLPSDDCAALAAQTGAPQLVPTIQPREERYLSR